MRDKLDRLQGSRRRVGFGFVSRLEEDRSVFAQWVDGEVELATGLHELRGVAIQADEPRAAVGKVVVQQMAVDGDASDVAAIRDAEEVLDGAGR